MLVFMNSRFSTLAIAAPLLAAGLVTATGEARAQSLNDRFWIEGAALWADVNSEGEFRLPNAPRDGVAIDFESDLGLNDKETLGSINAGFRAFDRVIIGADYYRLDRSSSASLGRDIQFEDVTFPIAASVESGFSSDIYRLTIGYALIRNDTLEIGPSIGLHATDFDIFVSGEARVGQNQNAQTVRQRDFLAPLPTVGLFGAWSPTPRLTINGRVDYMSLSLGDYDGGVTNVQAGVSYALTDHFDLGVMYRFVDYDLTIEKDAWTGDLNYDFQGPAVFIRASF